MKFSVSNLAWAPDVEDQAFALLTAAGFSGIEVAPTRIADWADLDAARIAAYRRKCDVAGLSVSSLQAIFFNRPDAQLLGDASGFSAMLEHTRHVANIGGTLGASVAVFGAPRNRIRGTLNREEAEALAVDRLQQLGDILRPSGMVLGLEPVPTYYGADFVNHIDDLAALVDACAHPAIGLHFDCACVHLAGDDVISALGRYGRSIVHYHAAEPDLGPFDEPRCDHGAAARALRTAGYNRWLAIEMRQQGESGLPALQKALALVGSTYGLDASLDAWS